MANTNQHVDTSQLEVPKNGYWTSKMTRALLDCLDDAAGNDTIFITDRAAAFQKAMTALQSVTHPDTFSKLTEAKIFNKLEKQNIAAGRPTGVAGFLRQGTKSVDLSKLQTGAYSKAEINASKKSRPNNKTALVSTASLRTIGKNKRNSSEIEYQETVQAAIRTTGKKRANSSEREYEEIGRAATKFFSMITGFQSNTRKQEGFSNKRVKHTHPISSSYDGDLIQISTRRKRNTRSNAIHNIVPDSEGSDDEVTGEGVQEVEEEDTGAFESAGHPVPTTNASINMKTFVCEVCDQEFPVKKLLQSHKLLHEQPVSKESTSQSPIHYLDGTERAQSSVDDLRAQNLYSGGGGEPLDVEVIQSEMANIQTNIFNATDLFFSTSKIDSNEAIPLRVDLCEDSLIELLRTMFGSGLVDRPRQSDIASPSPASVTKRREIVMAVVGCAVTEWALRPLPQGEISGGVFGEMNDLLRTQSPALQDNLMELATYQYLDKHVKPLAKNAARELSHDLFRLLCHFLPATSQEGSLRKSPGTSAEQENSSSGSVRIILRCNKGLSKWPPKAQNDPIRIYLESLQDAFGSALKLRLNMEMKGNANYDFTLPRSGTTLDLTQFVVRNKLNNRKIRDIDSDSDPRGSNPSVDKNPKKVLLGLTPTVHATFRKRDRAEGWEKDAILVSKGCVYIRDM